MARKKKQPEVKTLWEKAKWKGFVATRLTDQERAAIKKELLSPEGVSQFFMDAASAGYKVSLSYSIPEDVYTVSLTGQYQDKPNGGLTVSMRHRECDVAVTALWWCVNEDGYAIDWEQRFGKVDVDDW